MYPRHGFGNTRATRTASPYIRRPGRAPPFAGSSPPSAAASHVCDGSLSGPRTQRPHLTLLFTDVVMPDINGRKLAEEGLSAMRSERNWSSPAVNAASRYSRNNRRNRRDSTRTDRKKFGLQAIQRSPFMDTPPPGTMQWTWDGDRDSVPMGHT